MHTVDAEELNAYFDGELAAARESEIRGHLQGCADCREALEGLRSVSLRMGEWRVEEPVASAHGLPKRIQDRLGEPRLSRAGSFLYSHRWHLAAGGAVVAISLLLVPGLFIEHLTTGRPAEMAQFVSPRMAASRASLPSQVQFRPRLESEPAAPLIVRSAEISLTTREFANNRTALEAAVKRCGGYIASLELTAPENAGRSLDARIRVPASSLDPLLADLRKLGHVVQESQSGDDVTKQYVDLDARLRNAQNTEERLTALQRDRTGKLADVLAVETEISRVRGEIEQMAAEKRTLVNRVDLATVHVIVNEEVKAQVNVLPRSGGERLRNAAVAGYEALTESLMGAVEFLLAWGPRLVLWAIVLFWPARAVWRRVRQG